MHSASKEALFSCAARYNALVFLDPADILKHVHLPSYKRVGDFGTGSGQYALAAAEALGTEGAVYALEAFGPLLEKVRRAALPYGGRFYALQSDLNEPLPLRDNLLNLAIVANTLHALTERKRFLSELRRVLAPEGRVLFVDWASSFRNMGPTNEAAISPGEAVRLFTDAGFTTGTMLPAGTHHYAFIASPQA